MPGGDIQRETGEYYFIRAIRWQRAHLGLGRPVDFRQSSRSAQRTPLWVARAVPPQTHILVRHIQGDRLIDLIVFVISLGIQV